MLSVNTSTCRLCLTNEDVFINIFSSLHDYPFRKIQTCLPIKVTEYDRLPQRICQTCHSKVTFFHEFWNQTLQAEQHFMSLLVTNTESLPSNLYSCNLQNYEAEVENPHTTDDDARNVFHETNLSNSVHGKKALHLSQSFEGNHNIGLFSSPLNSLHQLSDIDIRSNALSPKNCAIPFMKSEINVEKPVTIRDNESRNYTKEEANPSSEKRLPNQNQKSKNSKFKLADFQFSCDKCHFTTNVKSTFIMHSKRHVRKYNLFCPECNVSFLNKPEMISHNIEVHEAQPFQCAHCNDVFTSKNTLYGHIKSHDPSCVHICEICGKTYKKKNSYKRHINRNHHGNAAKAQCAICNRILSSKEHLRRHMLVHTDERNWVCSTCGKCYRSKCYLTEHSRIHAGIKPYKCEICGKCFTQRGSLTIHKRSHTGERPYKCEYCDRSFIISTLLRYHLKKCSLVPTRLDIVNNSFESEPVSVITVNTSVKIDQ